MQYDSVVVANLFVVVRLGVCNEIKDIEKDTSDKGKDLFKRSMILFIIKASSIYMQME